MSVKLIECLMEGRSTVNVLSTLDQWKIGLIKNFEINPSWVKSHQDKEFLFTLSLCGPHFLYRTNNQREVPGLISRTLNNFGVNSVLSSF